ncbi:hypothetical protein JCM11251_007271 [Rhodosporidiobolus azoricus]
MAKRGGVGRGGRRAALTVSHSWAGRAQAGPALLLLLHPPSLTLLIDNQALLLALTYPTAHNFKLVLGYTPSLLPSSTSPPSSLPAVEALLAERKNKISEVRDALAAAKVRQAEQANRRRGADPEFRDGDLVMVDSADQRSRYKTRGGDVRAAKLFPRWDGPYAVNTAFPATSTYRLTLPPNDRAHPVFHSSKLKRYLPNDPTLHSDREPPRPEPIDVDGEQEYRIEKVVDEKGKGARQRFLVKWEGYPDSDNTWEPLFNVDNTEALEEWEQRVGS